MLASATRAQRSTRALRGGAALVVAGLVVAAPGCTRKREARHDPGAGSGSAALAPPEPASPDDGGGRITIGIAKPRSAAAALGRRCVMVGDPLTADCVGGTAGLALGRDGTLYVASGPTVRRYRRAAEGPCRYEPSAEPIELPPDNPRPQKVGGGPIYMRSGGPSWQLAGAGEAIYALDFLAGLFRIDRGRAEPACTEVFGFRSVAARGTQLLAVRDGIARLALGKAGACKATSAGIDDQARGTLHVVRDQLLVASGSALTRYDDATPVTLGAGTRICSITTVTACGDGACVVDNNCMQIVQLDAAGQVARTLDDRTLFPTRPWSLSDAITLDADGAVLVLARHRDKVGDRETCEAAIYELPAALFAR